jgi:probable phosphomutase (TIGR03848 family)
VTEQQPHAAPDDRPSGGTLILVRHGRSTANGDGVLAGRTPGVDLDETGSAQAAALVARLAGASIARLVSSPLRRCRSTLAPLAASLVLEVQLDERIAEVDYGSWTGRKLQDLAGETLWRTVQAQPSAAVFPDGEALAAVSARAVRAAREHALSTGEGGAALLCSHGDVIKAILADALGMHLDSFQRLVVSPASISVVRYGPVRTFVERINDTGSLDGVGAPPEKPAADGAAVRGDQDAVVGGDTGTGGPTPHDPGLP